MSIQHLNDVQSIARTAARLGAALPERITLALTHLDDLTHSRPEALRPGVIARELAEHLGNPAAMDKALKRAATDLAAADATAKIHAHLAETCGSRVRGMMKGQAEEIAAAFGVALAPDLDTLAATAGRLPEWFNPEQAATLDAETFAAWTRASDAYARIQSAQTALAPLYSGAIASEHVMHFPVPAAAALRFVQPPRFSTTREAYAFRDALSGRAERIQGLAGQGSTFVDGLFVPTALAHIGATFEWATPTEVTARAQQITAGMVRHAAGVA